jgi:putative ABC transport system ATP-binding protein
MINLDQVTVRAGEAVLLDRVDLAVEAGEKVVVTGPSGSGKTSLLKVIIGLHRPNHGRILVGGDPVGGDTIRSVRSRLTWVPQTLPVFPDETGRTFLNLPFTFRANRDRIPDAAAIARGMDALALSAILLDRPMGELSGGERQRMALVQALLLRRPVLLLDEVTSAVDAGCSDLVADAILGDPAVTVLSVSHDPGWCERADRTCLMDAGRLAPSAPRGAP